MGYLLIDHSQGIGPDGKPGKKYEYGTVRCAHCERIVAMLRIDNETVPLANLDIFAATMLAKDLTVDYVGKRTCSRCGNKAICRICAAAMEANGGTCPGPLEAQREVLFATDSWDEANSYVHDYGKTVPVS